MLKEEAIRKHRAMWNWIAQQIENEKHTMNIGVLKANYVEHSGDNAIEMYKHNNCYLCNYTDINCYKCPLIWPSEFKSYQCEHGFQLPNGYNRNGLYSECWHLNYTDDWQLQAKLAREIANLPEQEE